MSSLKNVIEHFNGTMWYMPIFNNIFFTVLLILNHFLPILCCPYLIMSRSIIIRYILLHLFLLNGLYMIIILFLVMETALNCICAWDMLYKYTCLTLPCLKAITHTYTWPRFLPSVSNPSFHVLISSYVMLFLRLVCNMLSGSKHNPKLQGILDFPTFISTWNFNHFRDL